MSLEQKLNYQLNKIPGVKKVIKRVYQRTMYAISPKIKSEGNIVRISPDDSSHEYFFGYYDKSPWDISDRYMLCMRANNTWSDVSPKEKADIVLIDTALPETDPKRVKKIAETSSWNVQQSCMLQWLGPDFSSRILFNDYRDGKYVSVIKEIESGKERVIPAPVYTVSADGKTALTLDFSRLYNLRPGYGYYNVPEKTEGVALPDATAVWKIDLESGEVSDLLTYKDFATFQSRPEMQEEGSVHKVNHLMLSPSGERCMVLYRWFVGQRKYTRLVTFNTDGSDMYVLSDDDMVSHCFWKDDERILAFENKKDGGPGYYFMTDKTQEYIHCWPQLSNDGHPSYSPDRSLIVTDTYPDRARVAEIKLMDGTDESKADVKVIARVFAPFKYDNDTRCDLHPRWNHKGDTICFDSIFEGHRGLYVVNVETKSSNQHDHHISVAMTSYNGEKYIEKQIMSIVKQSVLPDEIVICDDGSTDNTIEIIENLRKAIKEVEVSIFRNDKNLGYSLNFLQAIRKCTGDIIFLADQDDVWFDRKIEKMLEVFNQHADALAVSCAYDLINTNDELITNKLAVTQKSTGKVSKVTWREFVLSTRYPGMSMAIRKALIQYMTNLPENMIPAHDWLLNEAASYHEGMYYLEEILTHYRQHEANNVGAIKGDSKEELLKSRMHTLRFFESTHKAIRYMHTDEETQKWADSLLKLDELRVQNLNEKRFIRCIYTYMINRNNMTKRCFAGDIYTIARMK